ncbi:MAG: type II secretion system protein [Campylobacterales bacterium]|nr:type II secretion system protein [Campylobacterales bacterium]
MKFKQAFTLFEILISLVLVTIVYLFAINSFNISSQKEEQTTLTNFKEYLLKQNYENEISIKCTDSLKCLIFVDGVRQEQILSNIFRTKPEVYSFEKEYRRLEFPRLELENLESYEIVFDFTCKNKFECDEYILDLGSKGVILTNLENKPIEFEYFSDVRDYFEKKIEEVQDAL